MSKIILLYSSKNEDSILCAAIARNKFPNCDIVDVDTQNLKGALGDYKKNTFEEIYNYSTFTFDEPEKDFLVGLLKKNAKDENELKHTDELQIAGVVWKQFYPNVAMPLVVSLLGLKKKSESLKLREKYVRCYIRTYLRDIVQSKGDWNRLIDNSPRNSINNGAAHTPEQDMNYIITVEQHGKSMYEYLEEMTSSGQLVEDERVAELLESNLEKQDNTFKAVEKERNDLAKEVEELKDQNVEVEGNFVWAGSKDNRVVAFRPEPGGPYKVSYKDGKIATLVKSGEDYKPVKSTSKSKAVEHPTE